MKRPIIEFKNFTFKYNVQMEPTLKNINFTIYEGEKVLIMGPSGSGKSTIGHCLNGLIPHAYKGKKEGNLLFNGEDVFEQSIFERSKSIGTVLQDSDAQFVSLTVGEDIAFSLENNCEEVNSMREKVKKIAKVIKMQDFLESSPYDLSGGQKQRVALGGVMIDDSKIILYDEPLANLDPLTGKTAIELIDNIHKELNKTTIIIEHRLEDVMYKDIDRVILIDDGMVIYNGNLNDLLHSELLVKYGIREPLYLTAIKYAKQDLDQDLTRVENLSSNLNMDQIIKNRIEVQDNKTNKELLSFENVSFSYDKKKTVLDDISFKIYENEMISIVGKNGAGKSTISKLILGFIKPSKGKISYCGKDMKDLTIFQRAQEIGLVLQNPNQMISKSLIFDEVALGLRNRGVDEEVVQEKVKKTLEICGLSSFIDWPISALSFGQKKRVTIASILVLDPKIIILDEPTAGQDYRHYKEILQFLSKLNKLGHTIIMITHDMHLMLEYTNRCIVVANTKIEADSMPYKVLCDKEIIEAANLKETSLFTLANHLRLKDPVEFVKDFINYERVVNDERL